MNKNNLVWHNETRKLKELVPASYNPRKLTEKQHDDLKKSLEKFNLAEIPVINLDNTILAGHMRVRLMTELYGLEHEIEVRVPSRQLTEEEAREYNIRSNKNVGQWDFDILANEFNIEDLEEWGFNSSEFGTFNNENIVNNDPLAEWESMPSYTNKERGYKSIVVHFKEESDIHNFEVAVNQKINDSTKYIWFPKRERDNLSDYEF